MLYRCRNLRTGRTLGAVIATWIVPAMKARASFILYPGAVLAVVAGVSPCCAGEPVPGPVANAAMVIVAKASNACFSDLVRVTGFLVPRREAQVNADTEGSRVAEVLVREGDKVTENQDLARLTLPGGSARTTLRAPAAGLVTAVGAIAGAPASPQAGPMFRIAINGEFELDAEVPSIHILKLNPGATARISRDGEPDIAGKVRVVSPQIDRTTQLGHVRLSLGGNPGVKVGIFARADIDARRSCGVAVPRSALDHLTVQVVKDGTIETRRVRVGLVSDTSTEILEGVDVGDSVVADAGTSLHDGDKVQTMVADDLDRVRVR
jgi:multidrug efflux pump subunit AcrA (membrane-fusion protein)